MEKITIQIACELCINRDRETIIYTNRSFIQIDRFRTEFNNVQEQKKSG